MNIESVSSGQICPFAEKHVKESKSETREYELSRNDILRMYSDYAGSVFNFFYYSTGNRDIATDLVNDVFVKVLDKSWRFDPRKGDIKVWLFAVARNTLRDYFRSHRRKKPWLAMDEAKEIPASGYANPDETLETKAEILALTQALESLNKRERSLVSLKYGAGLRNKDIAGLVGLTEKNVGVILCRALSKLRQKMRDGR